jgi:hypothetical protein
MAGREARDTKLAAEFALRTHSFRPLTDIVYVEGSHMATGDAVRVDLAMSRNVHGGVIGKENLLFGYSDHRRGFASIETCTIPKATSCNSARPFLTKGVERS